ncbi:hypothetical protein [Oceanibacterium hippocampi]|uniref:Uncharacterized protein n=1 Tax=Oceanibacterium hippocampi TaxID=745714 RepID=A0A1Y5U003_9PROT|nr:hypothetical protein [Oceanibacterium hippocampi]SLN77630.1 hypothetical protein OCH7691_04486 [Oceanibacterium hippocampi]
MPDPIAISELPAEAAPGTAAILVVVQGGQTSRITAAQLLDLVAGSTALAAGKALIGDGAGKAQPVTLTFEHLDGVAATRNLALGFTAEAVDHGNSGAAPLALDPLAGGLQQVTATGDFTINAPATAKSATMALRIVDDGNPRTITFAGFTVMSAHEDLAGAVLTTTSAKTYIAYVTKIGAFVGLDLARQP